MSAIPIAAIRDRRGPGPALLLAGLCVAGMALTWVLAEIVPATHVRDAIALYDFTRLNRPIVEVPANALLGLLEPWFFTVWGLALVWLAISQGRARVALAVAFALPLAPLTAELLKPLLAHSHAQVAPVYIVDASWPSGHSTAVTVLAWCAVLVAPPARRGLVAVIGALLAAAVGCSLLILAWHMPSDVLGGYLLGTLWAALAVAVLRMGGSGRGHPASIPGSSASLPDSSQARLTSSPVATPDLHATVSVGVPPPCAPGAHSGSDRSGESTFAARPRMNSMSDSLFK